MNITAALGLGLTLSLPFAASASEYEVQVASSTSGTATPVWGSKVFNTGYVNMSATYPLNAETFTIKCHKEDGTATDHDLTPLHGYSTNCKTSDVYEKSGNLVQAGVGHGCHFIWGKIPFIHPNPSVAAGIGCPDMAGSGKVAGSGSLDIKLFPESPFPEAGPLNRDL